MGWTDFVHGVQMVCPKCSHGWVSDWTETKSFNPPHADGCHEFEVGVPDDLAETDGEMELCDNCTKCDALVWAYCPVGEKVISQPTRYRWFDYDTEKSTVIPAPQPKEQA